MFWERGRFAAPTSPREPNVGFEIMDSFAAIGKKSASSLIAGLLTALTSFCDKKK